MTTREDYKFAAKAAGYEIEFFEGCLTPFHKDGNVWKPDRDDGDSRRLEVACFMLVNVNEQQKRVEAVSKTSGATVYFDGLDPCAATRAAVFRCAVEIGKRLTKGGE